jgi:hypothetical protein
MWGLAIVCMFCNIDSNLRFFLFPSRGVYGCVCNMCVVAYARFARPTSRGFFVCVVAEYDVKCVATPLSFSFVCYLFVCGNVSVS